MGIEDRWLLPDGVEDVLPPQAKRLEMVRRRLLDLFSTWGYEYVIPPMIEFLESLLTGTGRDLDIKTFKIVDLMTGRSMGIRADITPQVARIDAHSLNQQGVARLCYAGTVVQAKADSMLSSRTPLSVGAELFGESSCKADIEIVSLMAESLQSLGFERVHIDLGDVAIFRQLLDSLSLSEAQQELLFAAVQRKSVAEIKKHCQDFSLPQGETNLLCNLPGLTGDISMLDRAVELFTDHDGIIACIENLRRVAMTISDRFEGLDVYFDLSELRGYAYHTGIVFAAYVNGSRQVVAKGGRYDHIGQVFGRSDRGATGFSVDVRTVAENVGFDLQSPQTVLAPEVDADLAKSLWKEVQALRKSGYAVIESGPSNGYDFEMVFENDQWQLRPAANASN